MGPLRLVLVAISLSFLTIVSSNSRHDDSACYSRFDYDSKMLERIIMVEHRINLFEDTSKKELNHVHTELRHMKGEQNKKFQEILKRFDILQEKLEHGQKIKFDEMSAIGNDMLSTSARIVELHRLKQDEIDAYFENLSVILQNNITMRHDGLLMDLREFKAEILTEHENKLAEMTTVRVDMNTLSENLKDEQSVKLQVVEAIGDEIKVEIQERMVKLEIEAVDNKQEYQRVYQKFEETVNETWGEIKVAGLGIKPSVAFNVWDVTDTYPESGDPLIFSYILTNTISVYDSSTGIFTAPVNGTYWFSAQICSVGYQISFRIVANDNVISDSTTCPNDNTCKTSDAVTMLKTGDTVHVALAHSFDRRNRYYHAKLVSSSQYKRSAFMGALVH